MFGRNKKVGDTKDSARHATTSDTGRPKVDGELSAWMRKTAVKPKVKTESRTAATAAEEVDHNLRRMEKSEDNGSFVT